MALKVWIYGTLDYTNKFTGFNFIYSSMYIIVICIYSKIHAVFKQNSVIRKTILGLLPSSHKLAACGGTDGLNVVVFQFHPFASQLVQHGCVDL